MQKLFIVFHKFHTLWYLGGSLINWLFCDSPIYSCYTCTSTFLFCSLFIVFVAAWYIHVTAIRKNYFMTLTHWCKSWKWKEGGGPTKKKKASWKQNNKKNNKTSLLKDIHEWKLHKERLRKLLLRPVLGFLGELHCHSLVFYYLAFS